MKRAHSILGVAILLIMSFASSCQSSKAISFTQNESGVYMAQKSSIPKGAVRLTVELRSDMTQGDGEYYAEAEVLEVVAYGATYSRAKIRKGEMIRLSIVDDIEGKAFKKGDKVMLDGLTPISKSGELLDVSML